MATGLVTALFLPAQGVTASEFVGRRCTVTSVLMCGYVEVAANNAKTGGQSVRVELVLDTQANGADFDADVDYRPSIFAYRNLDNATRFKTLWSKIYTVSPSALVYDSTADTYWTGAKRFPLNVNIDCCIPVDFDGATGALTEQTMNAFKLLTWENATTPATSVILNYRCRYVDS